MPLHLDILDVGQGDGMVVWLPNGKVMMVDLGSTKNKGIVTTDSFKYFRDHTAFSNQGQSLEWLVLTHGDRDHFNMVAQFLTDFAVNVRNVLHGGLEGEYGGLIGWLRGRNPDRTQPKVLTGTNTGVFPLATTDALGADVKVLASGVQAVRGNAGHVKNTRSVVLRIDHKGKGIILAGDATCETEDHIRGLILSKRQDPAQVLAADVLKIGHHGSHRTSNHARWLQAVNPRYAFISSDRSGSLDDDQRPTGFRLPQALTIQLLRKYSTRLEQDLEEHTYVMSYQRSDFEQFNARPDIPGETLPFPASDNDLAWIEMSTKEGIFSTLARMGLSLDPTDEGAADLGVQYRLTIFDDGSIDVLSTDDDDDMDTDR
jgi:beta-lactamase superfamily II metal-dependent hydrolase